MRNKIMFMVSAGSAALILSGAAMAEGAPIPFDGWSVTGSTITATCAGPTGTTCVTAMSGADFLQRNITVPGTGGLPSVQYIQTIVRDNAGFKDESFVRMGGGGNGIAGKQSITESSTSPTGGVTVFTSAAELQTGWAAPAAGNLVKLTQGLNEAAANFVSNFGFSQTTNNAGLVVGKGLDLGQSVGIAQAGTTDADKQIFVLRQRSGTSNPGPADSFTLQNGTSLPYAEGDDVKVTWIGQGVSLGAVAGSQNFGYQSYENLTDPGFIKQFDLAAMGPFDATTKPWKTTLFGIKPDYATGVFNPTP